MATGKRVERKLRRRKTLLRCFLLILISLALYLFIFKMDFFNVKTIKVVGAGHMDAEQIIQASPFVKGDNIFRINKAMGEEALNILPYIKSSKVKRNLPDEIIIEIKERKETAVIPYIGAFVYIDEEGYILSIEERKEGIELPQILGVELADIEVGNNVFEILDIPNMTDFILIGQKSGILPSIKYINCSNKNNIVMELKDGIKVAFGPLHNVKYKYSFLVQILKDIKEHNRDVSQIMFNKGDNPVVITSNQQGELYEKDK